MTAGIMSLDLRWNRTVGMEYRIEFSASDHEPVDGILQSLNFTPHSHGRDTLAYEFRNANNHGLMPNASAEIDADGLYFCDFGGASEVLNEIVQQIGDRIGPTTLSELE